VGEKVKDKTVRSGVKGPQKKNFETLGGKKGSEKQSEKGAEVIKIGETRALPRGLVGDWGGGRGVRRGSVTKRKPH